MELLLKRNEKAGALGTRYDLFAKLEPKPEAVAQAKAHRSKVYLLRLSLPRESVPNGDHYPDKTPHPH